MKSSKIQNRIGMWISAYGFNWTTFKLATQGNKIFKKNLKDFQNQLSSLESEFEISKLYPCLTDRFRDGGTAKGHYFHQDLLVARKIYKKSPKHHCDVGSRVDGFIAHVAVFREIEAFDIRKTSAKVKNIRFSEMDLLNELPLRYVEYCDSLSCLHALEHFGLGRYNDEVRANGHIDGYNNLHKMLKPGGILYLSVPIGPLRVEFDAHRVFSVKYLIALFRGRFEIQSFSYVDKKGDINEDVEMDETEINLNFGCSYGCGIFELVKI